MVEYNDSSQLLLWHFSADELKACRSYANYKARQLLHEREQNEAKEKSDGGTEQLPVSQFACDPKERDVIVKENYDLLGPLADAHGNPYLTAAEEAVLISFYAAKLPALIGPIATVRRLRRDSKVLATACSLYRRFFLSNSVLVFDPKSIMVAAAFLASKVEDATADVRSLEEGTTLMNAHVSTQEICLSEVSLLAGTHFYLLCFHPYKAVLSLTEDLRTFFKTAAGRKLQSNSEGVTITGQDLKPVYEAARSILDDVVVSDLILQYSPGQIGLAALRLAQQKTDMVGDIDLLAYVAARFPQEQSTLNGDDWMATTVTSLAKMLAELKEGMHGCGNYNTPLAELKGVHKRLKFVRAWGEKKKKKRKGGAAKGDKDEKSSKRAKLE